MLIQSHTKQLGKKLLIGIKLTAKWLLIQFLFYLIYGLIDYALEQLLFGWNFRRDFTIWGLWLGVNLNTVLFAFWHAFFDKKRQWWTIIFPWLILLGLTLYLRIDDRNFRWDPFDHYLILAWISPLFGITIQCIWYGIKHIIKMNKDIDAVGKE